MSDFIPRDILPDLWEEILRRHWTFLETEESMQKLEERKKLEGCLKEFLCIVPHDRKFFLPETAHVLKKSIKEMDDFSAYKAMIGFESISQYANNLFTKPWRKEYRIIKMYSGFYQHEIKSNLIDADKLFEAMGYKQLPNQILVLDGPICPDQVTNVSRDAMAAYVECQIMKQIFSGLTCMQMSCSWLDVFNFREKHIGIASQAVKSMAYSIQERRYHKEKFNAENCYSTGHQQSQPVPPCAACTHQYHSQSSQTANACNQHPLIQQPQYSSGICSLHPQSQQNIYNVPVPHHYKQSNFIPPQMSHSKSLEHYGEHINSGGILPHRHSFDQPYDSGRSHYDMNYDCVDGYQSCNFNAYNHPYNVSGNRYPLPYNISNQLNNQFAGPCGVNNAGHYPPPPPPPPSIVSCGHKITLGDPKYYGKIQSDQLYGDCNGYQKKPQDICNYHNSNSKDLMNYRQCGYVGNGRSAVRTEQLIDFDDRPSEIINSHNIAPHHSRSQNNSLDYNDRVYDQGINNRQHKFKQQTQHYDTPKSHFNITNQTPKDLYNRNIDNPEENDGNYLYAGTQRPDKKMTKKNVVDKYARNAEILEQYEKIMDNNDLQSRGVRDSYDSFDDIVKTAPVDGNDSIKSKSISNKNQDGVGSFESWDYVFQNLEKHGYTKDLGERGDLLVQGLDLDSMNVGNASEKRRSRNLDTKLRTTNDAVKSKTLEKTDLTKDSNVKQKVSEKSILKYDNDSTVQKATITKSQVQKAPQPVQKQSSTKVVINNNVEHHQNNDKLQVIRSRQVNKERPSANGSAPSSSHHKSVNSGNSAHVSSSSTITNTVQNSSAGTVSGGGVNEWSCRFCTYLNPDTKRICEICCRSRDFVLDATNPPTCV